MLFDSEQLWILQTRLYPTIHVTPTSTIIILLSKLMLQAIRHRMIISPSLLPALLQHTINRRIFTHHLVCLALIVLVIFDSLFFTNEAVERQFLLDLLDIGLDLFDLRRQGVGIGLHDLGLCNQGF